MTTRHQPAWAAAATSTLRWRKRTTSSSISRICAVTTTTNTTTTSNSNTIERLTEKEKQKEIFQEAYERCWMFPLDGVSAILTFRGVRSTFLKYGINSQIGTTVKGTVFDVDGIGALVKTAKSLAFLPVREASIHKIKHVAEAGIHVGMQEEFMIIGENEADGNLILSLRVFQYGLAWERCKQLYSEDVIFKGKVVGGTKYGLLAVVEGLQGFIPFFHISTVNSSI